MGSISSGSLRPGQHPVEVQMPGGEHLQDRRTRLSALAGYPWSFWKDKPQNRDRQQQSASLGTSCFNSHSAAVSHAWPFRHTSICGPRWGGWQSPVVAASELFMGELRLPLLPQSSRGLSMPWQEVVSRAGVPGVSGWPGRTDAKVPIFWPLHVR